MKKLLLLFSIFCFSHSTFSQSVIPEWAVTYGDVPGVSYYVSDMVTDKAGNVYVYGIDFDTLNHDTGIIIKYNTIGVQQWIKYDTLLSNYFGKMVVDKEGNVYIICSVLGFSFSADFITCKFDSNGDLKWRVLYNGQFDNTDVPTDLIVDDSLNVYVTGRSVGMNTYYDFATIKYDSSGSLQWEARYDFSHNPGDLPYALIVDSLHNVYVTGQSFDTVNGCILTVKYDINGSQLWQRRVNGGSYSTPNCITISKDDFIYIGGTDRAPGTGDYICIKYDTAGTEQWVARYDAQDTLPYTGYDIGRSMVVDDSGNAILTGTQFYTTLLDDYATVRFDKNGTLLWVKTYDGGGGNWDDAYSIVCDEHGNSYVYGQAADTLPFQMFTTIKYDGNGNVEWLANYPPVPQAGITYRAVAASLDSLNNIYVCGYCINSLGVRHFLTVKYGLTTSINENHVTEKVVSIFPNPFHNTTTLKINNSENKNCQLKIYNTLGKLVETLQCNSASSEIKIDRKNLNDGLYFFQLTASGEQLATGKFVVE